MSSSTLPKTHNSEMYAIGSLRASYNSSPFERLPGELRNKIYTLCLHTDAPHEINQQTAVKCGVPCTGIILTNKAIYKESISILYGNCTFQCTIEANSHGFRHFINTIGDGNTCAMKKLCIRSTFDDVRHKAAVGDVFTILFMKCPSLKSLRIEALPVPAAVSLTSHHGNNSSGVAILAAASAHMIDTVISTIRAVNLDNTTRFTCWLIDQYGHKSCAFIGFDVTQVQMAEMKIRAAVAWHQRRKELQKQFAEGKIEFGHWAKELDRARRAFMRSTLL